MRLALDTPSLLGSRQKLLDLARKKVNREGYVYKKGKSRSIQFDDTSDHSTPKRPKMSENFRVKLIAALEKDIKDFNDRLVLKEKRRNQARNYKLCDQLTEEMSSIKRERSRIASTAEEAKAGSMVQTKEQDGSTQEWRSRI